MNNNFKEIRRTKQILTIDECYDVLDNEPRGVLSINSDNGYPYGIPMNHYFSKEENRLYFHGGKDGYKIDCLKKNNKCSYTAMKQINISDNGWSYIYHSVIIFGEIHFIEDINKIEEISRLLSHKFTNDESYINNEIKYSLDRTAMFYIDIKHMSGKRVNER